jgi:uncharacterized protein (TIGR02246 family)
MSRFGLFATVAFAIAAAAGCGAQPKVNLAAEEVVIRATDANWLAAATAHDLERILPFWADDATILPPSAPAVTGKQAIRQYISGAFATPGFSITWKTDKIEVSQSGDLAYSTGTDRISLNTPDGKSVTEENRGVVVWKKQPDGSWKCILDVMSPAAPSNAK